MGTQWTSGLFDCRNFGNCVLAFFCGPCMLSTARERYDGSSWCFNFCCGGVHAIRQTVRAGYGIETNFCETILACLCPICAAAQTRKEVDTRGRNPKTQQPPTPWMTSLFGDMCFDMGVCIYGWFCPGCAMASAVSEMSGMGFCYALCCMNSCFARNVVRHGMSVQGDLMEDVCAVWCCPACAACQALNEVRRRKAAGKA